MIDINETLIQKYQSLVYGLALTHVHNRYDADDVFQNVFLTLFQKRPQFENEAHCEGWLVKTTLNFCKKVKGSSWFKKVESLNHEPVNFQNDSQNQIFEALKELEPIYRNVIYLYYFHGYSIKELSQVLNTSESSIKMRLVRGREQMKGMIDRD